MAATNMVESGVSKKPVAQSNLIQKPIQVDFQVSTLANKESYFEKKFPTIQKNLKIDESFSQRSQKPFILDFLRNIQPLCFSYRRQTYLLL